MKVKQFQKSIEGVGTTLDPDEDWMPALFIEKDNKLAIIGLAVDLNHTEGKEIVAKVITTAIAISNADAACFISSAWQGEPVNVKKYPNLEDAINKGQVKLPKDDPLRREAVVAVCMGVRGESDRSALMCGFVERSPGKPPRISKWEIHDDCLKAGGRFPEAMHKGFEMANPTGNLDVFSEIAEMAMRDRENKEEEL